MDIATVLAFFDRFCENHRASCKILRLDVGRERIADDETRVTLTCSRCEQAITRAVLDRDLPQVTALLRGGKRH